MDTDRLLVRPEREQLEEALGAAVAAANRGACSRLLSWPPTPLVALWRNLTKEPEGWRQWHGGAGGNRAACSAAGVTWWTDHLGGKHVRVLGYRRRPNVIHSQARKGPALSLLYPQHTFFLTRGGERRLNVLCGCGVFGPPEDVAWMGDSCGPCYDQGQEGGRSPVRRMHWTLAGHQDAVYALAFSPDGKVLASGSGDGTVRLWDATTGEAVCTLGRAGSPILNVAFRPDGRAVAACTSFSGIFWWDVETGRMGKRIKSRGGISGLAYAPDGATLAACVNGRPALWDARSGKLAARFTEGEGGFDVAFLRKGRRLIAGRGAGAVTVYDTAKHSVLATLGPRWFLVNSLAPAPDGRGVALGVERGRAHQVWFWDGEGDEVRELPAGHKWAIQSIAFSPDGRTLLTGSQDATIKAWDVEGGRLRVTLEGHDHSVNTVVSSPDGRLVASGSIEGYIRLWPAEVFR